MKYIIFSILIFSSVSSFCQGKKHVVVGYNGLCCDHTTEWGEDEVYFITTARLSDGSGANSRYPGSEGSDDQINMNDGDDDENHCFKNRTDLIGLDIADGVTADVTVEILEQDGGTSKTWIDIANGVADYILEGDPENPWGLAIKFLASIFPEFTDTDDWIGTFNVKITNNNGVISTQWSQVARYDASKLILNFAGPNTCHMGFNGDGSAYRIDARVYE